jgi:hypothetical protein
MVDRFCLRCRCCWRVDLSGWGWNVCPSLCKYFDGGPGNAQNRTASFGTFGRCCCYHVEYARTHGSGLDSATDSPRRPAPIAVPLVFQPPPILGNLIAMVGGGPRRAEFCGFPNRLSSLRWNGDGIVLLFCARACVAWRPVCQGGNLCGRAVALERLPDLARHGRGIRRKCPPIDSGDSMVCSGSHHFLSDFGLSVRVPAAIATEDHTPATKGQRASHGERIASHLISCAFWPRLQNVSTLLQPPKHSISCNRQ